MKNYIELANETTKALKDKKSKNTLIKRVNKIIDNENVDSETLTVFEIVCVLFYNELLSVDSIKLALNNNVNNALTLDCNCVTSKFVKNNQFKVDYLRFKFNSYMIQIYLNKSSIRICTTCNNALIDDLMSINYKVQLQAYYIDSTTKKHNATTRAQIDTIKSNSERICVKTSEKNNIAYDDLVNELSTLIAILSK